MITFYEDEVGAACSAAPFVLGRDLTGYLVAVVAVNDERWSFCAGLTPRAVSNRMSIDPWRRNPVMLMLFESSGDARWALLARARRHLDGVGVDVAGCWCVDVDTCTVVPLDTGDGVHRFDPSPPAVLVLRQLGRDRRGPKAPPRSNASSSLWKWSSDADAIAAMAAVLDSPDPPSPPKLAAAGEALPWAPVRAYAARMVTRSDDRQVRRWRELVAHLPDGKRSVAAGLLGPRRPQHPRSGPATDPRRPRDRHRGRRRLRRRRCRRVPGQDHSAAGAGPAARLRPSRALTPTTGPTPAVTPPVSSRKERDMLSSTERKAIEARLVALAFLLGRHPSNEIIAWGQPLYGDPDVYIALCGVNGPDATDTIPPRFADKITSVAVFGYGPPDSGVDDGVHLTCTRFAAGGLRVAYRYVIDDHWCSPLGTLPGDRTAPGFAVPYRTGTVPEQPSTVTAEPGEITTILDAQQAKLSAAAATGNVPVFSAGLAGQAKALLDRIEAQPGLPLHGPDVVCLGTASLIREVFDHAVDAIGRDPARWVEVWWSVMTHIDPFFVPTPAALLAQAAWNDRRPLLTAHALEIGWRQGFSQSVERVRLVENLIHGAIRFSTRA